jgi:HlyD family secretion protein
MAKAKTRRKLLVFSGLTLVIAALAAVAIFKKREVIIAVQTQKVMPRNLTEIVVANGRIQPVTQVKISAEVSGEIIELPVKEGQQVTKGQTIVKIRPDFYKATRSQAEAGYKSSLAGRATADANLIKATAEFNRGKDLFAQKLISESVFDEIKAAFAVATAQVTSSVHQAEMARANLDSAEEQLSKTIIVAPLSGTISKLNSELGERVLGTVQNIGTEIMTIADLNEMEARVDIGEVDIVLIKPGQHVRLEVDSFKHQKFTGTVTEIANSAKSAGFSANAQEATKFEVRIRIKEKESFRPGMSVTAEIESRSCTNALTVPIASVTTRLPKTEEKKPGGAKEGQIGLVAEARAADGTNAPETDASTNAVSDRKSKEAPKPIEVVFIKEGDRVKMIPVKIGICNDEYWEVKEGLKEGQEVVSGSYRAISRDLEDGKRVRIGPATGELDKESKEKSG